MIRICISLRKVICFCTFIIIIDCSLEASGKLLLYFVGNIFLLKSCLSNISNKLAQDNELKFFISLNVSLAQVYFFFLPWFVHINIRLILRISIILINCLNDNFEQLKLIYKYIKSLDMFTFFLPGSKPFTNLYKQLRPGYHDTSRGDKVIFVYHQVWYEGHASITLFVERVVFTLSLGHHKKKMVYMSRDSNRFSEDCDEYVTTLGVAF